MRSVPAHGDMRTDKIRCILFSGQRTRVIDVRRPLPLTCDLDFKRVMSALSI